MLSMLGEGIVAIATAHSTGGDYVEVAEPC